MDVPYDEGPDVESIKKRTLFQNKYIEVKRYPSLKIKTVSNYSYTRPWVKVVSAISIILSLILGIPYGITQLDRKECRDKAHRYELEWKHSWSAGCSFKFNGTWADGAIYTEYQVGKTLNLKGLK